MHGFSFAARTPEVRPLADRPPEGRKLLSDTYELRILSRIRDVPRAAWDALVGESGSPFVEWTWLDCLEESGCVGADGDHSGAWGPCHLALYRTDASGERLVAAAPAYLKGNSEGEFVFDWAWADLSQRLRKPYYPKLVLAVPFTPATGERILVAEGEDRATLTSTMASLAWRFAQEVGAHSAHVLFPQESEAKLLADEGYLLRYGVQYHFHNEGFATWEDFLGSFNAKKRHQLKREVQQADKDGIRIETVPPDRIDGDVVRAMYRFYGATVDKFTWGRRYLNERFFELLAERYTDRLAWVMATRDGRPIAGAFNIEKGKRLYGRYWGADEELPFLHFNVCYYHGIKRAIARGLDVFEPGAGGEHKRVRGFRPTLTYSAHKLEDPRLRTAVEAFVTREREALTQYVATGGQGAEEP